jgi:hypothetical protein
VTSQNPATCSDVRTDLCARVVSVSVRTESWHAPADLKRSAANQGVNRFDEETS